MTMARDLVGQSYGRLQVVSRAESTRHGKTRFSCSCTCGRDTVVVGTDLTGGHTKSCGCWRVEAPRLAFRTHGRARSSEYRIWSHIKTRCLNPKSRYYHRYGGRGISMCPDWLGSFEAFFRDMGPRPSSRHSIDREDNNGSYTPGNCRWATQDVQGANRSTVRLIRHEGKADTMAGWARTTGISYLKLRRRIVDGWPIARALEAKDAAVRARLAK